MTDKEISNQNQNKKENMITQENTTLETHATQMGIESMEKRLDSIMKRLRDSKIKQ